jgi:prophage endopeptidase
MTTTANALRKSDEKAKFETQKRNADIDSGALRLRLKTTCPVPAATDSPAPTGDSGGEASAELDRETAKALIALTEEGDRAIEKLNACITLYNNARSAQ